MQRLLAIIPASYHPQVLPQEASIAPLVDRLLTGPADASQAIQEVPDPAGLFVALGLAIYHGQRTGIFAAPFLRVADARWGDDFVRLLGEWVGSARVTGVCVKSWAHWMLEKPAQVRMLVLAIPVLGCTKDGLHVQTLGYISRLGEQARPALEAVLAPDSPYKGRIKVQRPVRDLLGKLQPAPTERAPEGELLRTLVGVWARTHNAQLAEAIEVESKKVSPPVPVFKSAAERTDWWREKAATCDPHWLAPLLSELWPASIDEGQSRLKLLTQFPPDPRLAAFLARSITEGIYAASRKRHALLYSCAELLGKVGSPLESAKIQACRSTLVLSQATVDWLIKHLGEVPVVELSEEERNLLPAPPDATMTAEGLLEQILADPNNLGLRQVYADLLSEQGDVRGEFIVLQCGEQSAASIKRQDKLLGEHIEAWVSRPRGAIARGAWFQHGFLRHAMVGRGSIEAMFDDPLWATVDTLDLCALGHFNTKNLTSLLSLPHMLGIRHLLGITPEWDPGEFANRFHTIGMAHNYRPDLGKQYPQARVLEIYDAAPNPSIVKGTQVVHFRCAVQYLSVTRGKLAELKRRAIAGGHRFESIYLRMAGSSLEPSGWVLGLEGELLSTLVVQYFGGLDAKKHAAHLAQIEGLEGIGRVRVEAAAKIGGAAKEVLEQALTPFSGVSVREEVSVRPEVLIRRWVTGGA